MHCIQAGQQVVAAEAQRAEVMQMLAALQASNKKQAAMLSSQKAAVRSSPELVEIEHLEEAVQQAHEVHACTHARNDTAV